MGKSIFSALKVKSAKESDSPILKGKLFPTRQSNKGLYEDLVCDLDIQIKPLSSNMSITDASGRCLNIIGTAKMYISNTQVMGEKRKLVDGAVLEGKTTDREILISLKLLKDWGLVHSTFPQETVYNFITRTNKSKNSAYSALYSQNIENQIYEKEGTYVYLKEPSKGCKQLREKILNKYDKNFVTKLDPEHRMNVPPVKLVIDEERGV